VKNNITDIKDWKPARQFPETYPGDCPSHSYFIMDDRVFPLQFEDLRDFSSSYLVQADGRHQLIDSLLTSLGLPVLADRYANLAYGANRNPATLHIKFLNYGYQSPGTGLAVPVLAGKLRGADIVAGGLSGQGYLYGDLLVESELTQNTVIEAWIALLDDDQMRAINDSEGVGGGTYDLAQFPGFTIEGSDQEIAPLGYAGSFPIFISPKLGKPLSFSGVKASNRSLPAMTPLEMFNHLLDVFDIRQTVSDHTGLDNGESLAIELAKYMNGQWWYQFNTGDEPIRGYQRIVRMLDELIHTHSQYVSTADLKRKKGQVLSVEEAYHPGQAMTLKSLIG
jgi:hypothetical protein